MRSFRRSLAWLVTVASALARVDAWKDAAANALAAGDSALSESRLQQAIDAYAEGIRLLPKRWTSDESADEGGGDGELPAADEMGVIMSLHTNYATALSYALGSDDKVLSSYRVACLCYRLWQREAESRGEVPKDVKAIATRSYFALGMAHQDLVAAAADGERQSEQLQRAAKSFAAAVRIDPNHWSSYANMGVVLADVGVDPGSGNEAVSLKLYEEGIMAYQKAIAILTGAGKGDGKNDDDDEGPTDPPENVGEVVAELNYRIGLCLVPFLFGPDGEEADGGGERKCTLRIGEDATPTSRSCLELAAYQFNTALQFHPDHDGANAALTLTTADAVFGMSTDVKKVQSLFEDYAPTFEHSLVDELGYNGCDRMRRGFDRAMAMEGKLDERFALVLDAGCGTGLAGEVFRNISQSLVGVDLSPTIIGLGKEKRPNLYDELKVGDVKDILGQYARQKQQISLLVAADTFIYFNDLNDLFASIVAGLEEGGYATFSLENVSIDNERRLNELKPDWRWQLTPSGRVAHRREYVEDVAKSHSLDVALYERLDDFRAENGKGVRGHMFVLQKRKQKDEL